jgi:hypothetical protein
MGWVSAGFEEKRKVSSLVCAIVLSMSVTTKRVPAGKLPKIFVDCLSEKDLAVVNAFKDGKRRDHPAIDNMIAIGRDFVEGQTPSELPDEVKVTLVGSAIMNDKRLRDNFQVPPADLLESRSHILSFLKSNNIIEASDMSNREIEDFFDNIWKGVARLMISKINWKSFSDWKNNQMEVLRSL